jgi:hypothetical protein
VQSLETIRADVVDRLTAAFEEIWPEELAPLLGHDLAFSPDGYTIHFRYQAAQALPPAAEQIIARSLENRLGIRPLRLVAERIPPPGPPATAKGARRSREH